MSVVVGVLTACGDATGPADDWSDIIQAELLPSVSTGERHACGLTESGAAFCWGSNDHGQLGNATVGRAHSVPQQVSVNRAFKMISSGGNHNCAVTSDHDVYCWGSNAYGEAGNPVFPTIATPLLIASSQSFRTVSSGHRHSCGLTDAGEAYCWGDNSYGQLGIDTTVASSSHQPVQAAADHHFVALAGGWLHTCGLTQDGEAFCWGWRTDALGTDSFPDQHAISTPTPVRVRADSARFVAISTGWLHSCGIADDLGAFCWGGVEGLGRDTQTSGWEPQPVYGGFQFLQLSAGDGYTCGVTIDNDAYCWGSNWSGRLGTGVSLPSSVPAPVAGGLKFAMVTAFYAITCGVTIAGETYCWGARHYPQLSTSVPVKVELP